MNHYRERPTQAQKDFSISEMFPRNGWGEKCHVCGHPEAPTNENPCVNCGFPQPDIIQTEKDQPMSQSMPVTLLEWRVMKKSSLRGFATVRIGKALKVSDVSVHASHGKRWASLPSKPQINRDGVALKDDNGKIKYTPVVSWSDRESSERFSEAVIAAVEQAHPGDTQADA